MRVPALFIAFALIWMTPPSAEADAMRCGSRLVTYGDTRSAVRNLCGEPAEIETRTIVRRPSYLLNGQVIYYGDGYVEVPVEIWTYNFGPNKLMRRIRFVDGLVDEIETLGHGYREERARDPSTTEPRDYP